MSLNLLVFYIITTKALRKYGVSEALYLYDPDGNGEEL